jgi:hypothetical protein
LILKIYEFDQATVEAYFLPVPSAATEEMAAVGRELLLDVPVNNIHIPVNNIHGDGQQEGLRRWDFPTWENLVAVRNPSFPRGCSQVLETWRFINLLLSLVHLAFPEKGWSRRPGLLLLMQGPRGIFLNVTTRILVRGDIHKKFWLTIALAP